MPSDNNSSQVPSDNQEESTSTRILGDFITLNEPLFDRAKTEFETYLKDLLDDFKLPHLSIEARVKQKESYEKKS